MKTIFRFLTASLASIAFIAIGATTNYAQNDACADTEGQTAVYTKFTSVYASSKLDELKTAVSAGKEFLEKYGSCDVLKDQIDFVKPQVARIEGEIPKLELAAKLRPLFAQFDNGIRTDNADEVLAAGKEILMLQPDNVNIVVPMGAIAFYKSTPANTYKYANDALQYGNMALSKIRGGWTFTKTDVKTKKPVVGALKYEYEKQEAIDEFTYTTAFLNYHVKKDKKAALPLFYELTKSTGAYKTDPGIFGSIGDYYVEQGAPVGEEIAKLISERKPEDSAEVLAQKETAINAKIALFNGYTERAIDAFSRAHKFAKSDTPAAKTYKDNLFKLIQSLYERRFGKGTTGMNEYISATLQKQFPDPTSEVQPIADPDPAKAEPSKAVTVGTGTMPATPAVKSTPDTKSTAAVNVKTTPAADTATAKAPTKPAKAKTAASKKPRATKPRR